MIVASQVQHGLPYIGTAGLYVVVLVLVLIAMAPGYVALKKGHRARTVVALIFGSFVCFPVTALIALFLTDESKRPA